MVRNAPPRQFDVCPNPDPETRAEHPYLVVLQSDLVSAIDTRVVAQRWLESHLPRGSQVAAESSTPPLPGFQVTPLELPGRGRPRDPNRSLARLRRDGVDYVLVTGAVADRVLAARADYPYETRFYDELRRRAQLVYRLEPGRGLSGPWVRVYHVPS